MTPAPSLATSTIRVASMPMMAPSAPMSPTSASKRPSLTSPAPCCTSHTWCLCFQLNVSETLLLLNCRYHASIFLSRSISTLPVRMTGSSSESYPKQSTLTAQPPVPFASVYFRVPRFPSHNSAVPFVWGKFPIQIVYFNSLSVPAIH